MEYISQKLFQYGGDVILSGKLEAEQDFIQHGAVTCYEHSLRVAKMSLEIAHRLSLRVDKRALVRGALLHDYFLYDWHIPDKTHRLHGFSHARTALKKAGRDFKLNRIEKDIIKKHMFPLTITPPKYLESWIVCLADKICAVEEFSEAYMLSFFRLIAG